MKAEKTLNLLTYFGCVVSGIIRKPEKTPLELIDEIKECCKELEELERLASKQDSMLVDDEDGVTFVCPSCYADNSKWIDWSMLQRQPKRAKRCQECGQLIKWGEENDARTENAATP